MKNAAVRWLYKHTNNVHFKVFLASLMNVITSLCTVFFALLMRGLIDTAVAHDTAGIRRYSAFTVLLTVCMYISFVYSHILQEDIVVRSMSDLRSLLISSLIRKDYSEVKKKHTGQWMNLLFSDIKVICEGTASIIPGIAGMISRLIFAFSVLAVLEPVLAGAYLGGGLLIFAGISLFRGKLKALHKEVQETEDRLHVFLQEVLENLLIIKVFDAAKHIERKTETVQNDYSKARLRRRKYRLISVNIFSFTFRLGYLVALIYGGYQLLDGTVSYGTLTAVLHIVGQMRTPIFNLSGFLPKIYEVIASTERLIAADNLKEEEHSDNSKEFYGLECNHVSFSYGRNEVIDDASFAIRTNDIIAVTGISGGGKSTLFLLLLGILNPDEGEIKIRTEKGLLSSGTETRSLFAYVPQGNALFTGTIRENIVFNHEYDERRLTEAMIAADAYDFIMELPEKEKTYIGERGTGLSEGQIQRIAIARAIYSNAPVLLLDESTSALDEETEARVLGNIRQLSNKTVLIVTHRPAAMKICKRHLYIEECKVYEDEYEC